MFARCYPQKVLSQRKCVASSRDKQIFIHLFDVAAASNGNSIRYDNPFVWIQEPQYEVMK